MTDRFIVNVCYTNNSERQWSRYDILNWVNEMLDADFKKVEDLCTGAAYCHLMDCLFRGCINMKRVKFTANQEYEYIENFRLLQQCFNALNIQTHLPIEQLVKGRFQDNFEFALWFKLFFESNQPPEMEPYDALAARGHMSIGMGPSVANGHNRALGSKKANRLAGALRKRQFFGAADEEPPPLVEQQPQQAELTAELPETAPPNERSIRSVTWTVMKGESFVKEHLNAVEPTAPLAELAEATEPADSPLRANLSYRLINGSTEHLNIIDEAPAALEPSRDSAKDATTAQPVRATASKRSIRRASSSAAVELPGASIVPMKRAVQRMNYVLPKTRISQWKLGQHRRASRVEASRCQPQTQRFTNKRTDSPIRTVSKNKPKVLGKREPPAKKHAARPVCAAVPQQQQQGQSAHNNLKKSGQVGPAEALPRPKVVTRKCSLIVDQRSHIFEFPDSDALTSESEVDEDLIAEELVKRANFRMVIYDDEDKDGVRSIGTNTDAEICQTIDESNEIFTLRIERDVCLKKLMLVERATKATDVLDVATLEKILYTRDEDFID